MRCVTTHVETFVRTKGASFLRAGLGQASPPSCDHCSLARGPLLPHYVPLMLLFSFPVCLSVCLLAVLSSVCYIH